MKHAGSKHGRVYNISSTERPETLTTKADFIKLANGLLAERYQKFGDTYTAQFAIQTDREFGLVDGITCIVYVRPFRYVWWEVATPLDSLRFGALHVALACVHAVYGFEPKDVIVCDTENAHT